MKSLKTIVASLVVFSFTALNFSCTRESPQVAPLDTNLSNSSTVQVINATVKSVRNYIYVDGLPISGAAVAFGGMSPGTAYGYRVSPGSHSFTIKDTSLTSTQVPITFTQALAAGNSYTIFTYDTTTSIKQLTVVNNLTIPFDSTCMIRFANFVYNTTAIPSVDVYSFRKGTATPIFSNVGTTQVTGFITVASILSDTFYVYPAGTKAPLLVKQLIPTLTPTRSYTSVYSGSYTGTKSIPTFATY